MSSNPLLQLLADGRHHSGAALGQRLGVSRAAVWKQLQKLRQLGLEVESRPGLGYRLPGGLDLLAADTVRSQLGAEARPLLHSLEICDVIPSTNARLLEMAGAGSVHGRVCAAEQQSAGRGRRGRSWLSPWGRGLWFSLGWEFQGGAAALEGLSLAVGVALVRALERNGVAGVRLKWPNDLVAGGAKLGGILVELSGDAAGPCQVVIGAGLNVRLGAAPGIDQPWTDLARLADTMPRRSILLGTIVDELLPLLYGFESGGFAPWRDAWLRLDALAGSEVHVLLGADRIEGVARGVDASGALMLDTDGGQRRFSGGEVSLRVAP